MTRVRGKAAVRGQVGLGRAGQAGQAVLLAVAALLAGCGDSHDAEIDLGGEELGPDRYAVLTDDGAVKMGLTDEYLYFSLSERSREEARQDLDAAAREEGVKGVVGGIVQKTVGRALEFRARFAVEEIRDVRWEDGAMRIVFDDPDRSLGDRFEVEDRPVTEAFPETAVRSFAEEFRRLKAERAERGDGDEPGAPDEPADSAGSADSAGGTDRGGEPVGG